MSPWARSIRDAATRGIRALSWVVLVVMLVSLVVQSSAIALASPAENPVIERLDPQATDRTAPNLDAGVRTSEPSSSGDDASDLVVHPLVESFEGTPDPTLPPLMTSSTRIEEGSDLLDRETRLVEVEDGLLENEARERIYDEVARSPGLSMSEVAERTDVPLSTARYHTWVLTKEDAIEEAKIRGKRRLFPSMMDRERMELNAALEDDATARMLDTVHRHEPASVSELAESLDRSASTVSYHLQRLQDAGLVERERDGGATVTQLDSFVRSELSGPVEADGGDPASETTEDE